MHKRGVEKGECP